jgi:hypothetical protein
VRALALSHSEIVALIINAINGMLVMTAVWSMWHSMFTISLILVIGVLFGPFFSFIISSSYSRVQWFIDRRLGGVASYNDHYRIFAWSFLPVSIVALLNILVLNQFDKPDCLESLAIMLPLIMVIILAKINYIVSVVKINQFTWGRGAISIIIAALFFLILLACCLTALFLLMGGDANDLEEFISRFMGSE